MPQRLVFLINLFFAFLVWGLVAWQYIWPALKSRPRADALRPILYLHAFRFVGLSFLIPGTVSPDLPAQFAQPAAWGDLLAATLALTALALLRTKAGLAVVWIFNIAGSADLVGAFVSANRLLVSENPGWQGAAYYIPAVYVPLLIATHVLVFMLLLRKDPVALVR